MRVAVARGARVVLAPRDVDETRGAERVGQRVADLRVVGGGEEGGESVRGFESARGELGGDEIGGVGRQGARDLRDRDRRNVLQRPRAETERADCGVDGADVGGFGDHGAEEFGAVAARREGFGVEGLRALAHDLHENGRRRLEPRGLR
jgi:hypothetical protein